MSVVVAIKEKDRVYIGCDSQVSCGYSKSTLTNPNNYKIWKVLNTNNTLMGFVGLFRDACIVRLMHNLGPKKGKIDYKETVTKILPKINDKLFDAGYISIKDNKLEELGSSFILASGNSIFEIGGDRSVLEIDDFTAIGSGENEALGSLINTVGEDPETRILKAIKASCVNNLYVNYPVIISDTKTCKMNVYDKKDVEKILGE